MQLNIWKVKEGFELSVIGDDFHFSANIKSKDAELFSGKEEEQIIQALAVGVGRIVVGNQSAFGLYLSKDEEYGTELIRDPRSQFINHLAKEVEVEKAKKMTVEWEAKCYELDARSRGKSLEEAVGWLIIGHPHFGANLEQNIEDWIGRYLSKNRAYGNLSEEED